MAAKRYSFVFYIAILVAVGATYAVFKVLESAKAGRVVRYNVRYGELTAGLRALADAIDACCPDCGADDCRPSCEC